MRSKLIIFFIVVLNLNGCAEYPIKKPNILSAASIYRLKVIKEPNKSKKQVVDEVVSTMNGDLNDDIAKTKVTEYASNQYDDIMSGIVNNDKRIDKVIERLVCGSKNSIFNYKYWRPSVNCSVNTEKTANRFESTAKLSVNPTSWSINGGNIYRSDAKINIKIEGGYSYSDGYLIGDISSIGYVLECYSNGHPEVVKIIDVNDKELTTLTKGISSSRSETNDVVNMVLNKSRNYLNSRYSVENKSVIKIEKNYRVDFATAKARLQRSLGDFKYENDKSAFIFSKKYHNDHTISHNFMISLFPDKNDTVVEFSGDYGYFKDNFGGNDLYGKAVYDEQIKSYISQVSSLLQR